MDNFKINFLSRGQLESLNLDRIFLPLLKIIITMLRGFFGNLIFAIIAQILCGNHLNLRSRERFEAVIFCVNALVGNQSKSNLFHFEREPCNTSSEVS